MKPYITLILVIFCFQTGFGQLEFTKQKKFFFLGADSIEGKRIISGVEIHPIDSSNLKLKIDILDNWIRKDSLNVIVKIDESSIIKDIYFITRNNKKEPSYRYYNDDGIEILIAKERWHDDSYNSKGEKIVKSYSMSIAKIFLPKDQNFHVKSLPIMFEK